MSFKQPPLPVGLSQFEEYAISTETSGTHSIGFTVAKITAFTETECLFELAGTFSGASDTTEDFAKAQPILSGDIKWDGCSNWDFHTADCLAHFCGRKDATGIGRLLDHLYDLAKEKMGPTWSDDLSL